MGNDVAGTIRKVTIEGITFRVAADTNATFILTNYEVTMDATSGRGMKRMIKRTPSVEALTLVVNGDERASLKSFAEDTAVDALKFSIELIGGDVYKSEGGLEIENFETESNRMTVQMLPREDWTKF